MANFIELRIHGKGGRRVNVNFDQVVDVLEAEDGEAVVVLTSIMSSMNPNQMTPISQSLHVAESYEKVCELIRYGDQEALGEGEE